MTFSFFDLYHTDRKDFSRYLCFFEMALDAIYPCVSKNYPVFVHKGQENPLVASQHAI
jgi:hypothetical protein